MFPQQQAAFNPTNATAAVGTGLASGVSSSFNALAANTRPATQTATFNPTQSLPQPQMGSVPYTPAPSASGFRIAVPQVIPSSKISSGPSPATVANIHSAYQDAQQYDNTAPVAPVTPQIPTAQVGSNPAVAANGTANNTDTTPAAPTNPYAEYAQQLASAEGYSPDYLAALKNKQNVDAQKAQLQSNFYTGANLPGDTLGYAGGFTDRESALNDISGLRADQALQVQTLLRQGNIQAAQSLVDAYKPTTVSPGSSLVSPVTGQESYSGLGGYQAVQGIQTVNNLAQAHPDANILPTDNLVTAAQKVSNSPSFQAGNLIAYATPSGGIGYINKLNIDQLQKNSDGTYQLLSGLDAANQAAQKSTITSLTQQKAQVATAIQTVDNNFPILSSIVQKYGLNTSVPLVNQFTNLADKQLGQTGINQLNALIPGLKGTISQIVAAGGSVDDKVRSEADGMLPNNVSYQVLNDIYGVVKREGAGRLSAFDSQIAQASQALGGAPSSTSQTTTGQTTNPFAPENFFSH